MTDELKPVRCGCGGEAKIIHGDYRTSVYCTNCGIQTCYYATEAEAIEAWNRAMSGVAKDINVPNKTAKVDWIYGEPFCPMCGDRLEWK